MCGAAQSFGSRTTRPPVPEEAPRDVPFVGGRQEPLESLLGIEKPQGDPQELLERGCAQNGATAVVQPSHPVGQGSNAACLAPARSDGSSRDPEPRLAVFELPMLPGPC